MGNTVLIIDDSNTMRKIVARALRQAGIDFDEILEAGDGLEALSVLADNSVDVVLSDINMPNMTGLELLKAVRGDDNFKSIPFVMVTAEGMKENVVEAVKAGVSNYIVKPFTAEQISEKLEKIF